MPLRYVAIAVFLSSVLVEAGPERVRTVRVEREHGFAGREALLGAAAAAVVIALVAAAAVALERRRSTPKGRNR